MGAGSTLSGPVVVGVPLAATLVGELAGGHEALAGEGSTDAGDADLEHGGHGGGGQSLVERVEIPSAVVVGSSPSTTVRTATRSDRSTTLAEHHHRQSRLYGAVAMARIPLEEVPGTETTADPGAEASSRAMFPQGAMRADQETARLASRRVDVTNKQRRFYCGVISAIGLPCRRRLCRCDRR